MRTHPGILLTLLAVLALTADSARAQTRPVGIGVIGGEPTGATVKIWFNRYFGMDVAAGADFGAPSRNPFNYTPGPAFQSHIELLAHVPLANIRQARIPIYIGGGAVFHWQAGFQPVRARTPIGFALLLPRPPFPWELFAEFAPTWGSDWPTFDPGFAAGVRYYF